MKIRREGRFTAGEPFKCPECRQRFGPGTPFLARILPDGRPWWACLGCAGVYAELTGHSDGATLRDDAEPRLPS